MSLRAVLCVLLVLCTAACGEELAPLRVVAVEPARQHAGVGAPVTVVTEAVGWPVQVDYGARAVGPAAGARAWVDFGAASAGEVPVGPDGSLRVTLPAGLTLGAHDVRVRWEDGREAVRAGGFELLPALPGVPRLTGVVVESPGPQRKDVPFAVVLRVEGPDTVRFAGDVTLRASKGRVYPERVGPFRAGVWVGTVVLDASHPEMVLSAADALGHVGRSAPFTVRPH